MSTVTLAIRLLLGATFAAAATTKLLTPAASRATIDAFGIGGRLARVGAAALGPSELVVAVGLIFVPTARWGGVGAVLLLLVFVGGITTALRQGRRPDCGCFGSLRPAPIGASTLVRNTALLVLAAFVVISAPGPAIDGWVAAHSPEEVAVVSAAIVATLAAIVYLPSVVDRAGPAITGGPAPLAIGTQAPDFMLLEAHGTQRNLPSLLTTECPLVLVFASPTCGSCVSLFPDLARWQRSLAERLRIAVVVGADGDAARSIAEDHGIVTVLSDPETAVTRAYGITASPSAFGLTSEGAIANGPAVGPDAIEELLRLTHHRLQPISTPWMQTTNAA